MMTWSKLIRLFLRLTFWSVVMALGVYAMFHTLL